MKALKCDACGEYFDDIEHISTIMENTKPNKLSIYYRAADGHTKDDCFLDICPECYMAIKKTMDDRIKRRIENARTENG